MNVLGSHITGAVTFNQALADALGSAIKGAFTTNLATHMGANTSLVRVGIRDARGPSFPEFRDVAAPVLGTAVGDNLPGQVAACFTLRTAGSGKSFRGRCFLSGWAESESGAGGAQAATVGTAGIAFLTAVDNALKSSGMELGVMTRPQDQVVITETTTHSDGSTTVRTLSRQTKKDGSVKKVTIIENRTNLWETQRKRANGRGTPPALLDAIASGQLA
jgi:hypothetical protein